MKHARDRQHLIVNHRRDGRQLKSSAVSTRFTLECRDHRLQRCAQYDGSDARGTGLGLEILKNLIKPTNGATGYKDSGESGAHIFLEVPDSGEPMAASNDQ